MSKFYKGFIVGSLLVAAVAIFSVQDANMRLKAMKNAAVDSHSHGFYDGCMEMYKVLTGGVGIPLSHEFKCRVAQQEYEKMVEKQAQKVIDETN